MSQWLTQVIESGQSQQDWLAPVRQAALANLQQTAWPTRRTEAWRFTPLAALEKRNANLAATSHAVEKQAIPGIDAHHIVFAGGELHTDLTTIALPEGVTLCSFADANDAQQAHIAQLMGSVKPQHHLFGMVNDAVLQQGIYLHVAAGVTLDKAIHIHNVATDNVDQHTRVLVHIESDAKATVIEHGYGDAPSANTSFAEYLLEEKAELEHYRFALYTNKALQLGGSHFRLHAEAQLNSSVVGFGSDLSRLDMDVDYAGENAHAEINAIYLLAEGELFDLHTTIEHAVPHCTTEENIRGIVGDNARAVFNGRIHIHRDAQKTLAELNNRNLLLSRRGVVNTKPELEIYADDVRCAHGATIAEISEQELYYLLSRGIKRSKALVMLNFGFIQELFNNMPNAAVSDWLQPILSQRFAEMEVK